ncbi:RcpC/CpaB family pilus assembly protein [Streptomyces sp. NBC_01280]|uniref:RcpC/CpaB family pilus assembly protein n=1 Tax=unclassified Streptomyces TaxID=2593676 RepID=UPI002256C3DA|nr:MULTISPECIES: RcpC/CpaB family pilus assembly protein [unclassified Streptomyces]MCX5437907.1 RcpC/CpaB family pilus assembly protein [Streptomyces sp. NBC_00063]WSE15574.1 RcpC/CpaB family pilus assembly protein [Streptomyces sp. NBC_01397]WUB95515.1 RcpC/CpaB family pilus assembly protein [Streptomyces sp. NBC_00569]
MSPFSTPPTCEVPHFAPLRVRAGRWRPRRAGRHRRRAVAAGLAVTAAVLVAAGPSGAGSTGSESSGSASAGAGPSGSESSGSGRERVRRSVVTVSAPVRIADAAAVRLLRPGDRVDVVAAGSGAGADDGQGPGGQGGRVVAAGARVSSVPDSAESAESAGEVAAAGGALVVLSVPRETAARLAGAGATSRLAVTLW